ALLVSMDAEQIKKTLNDNLDKFPEAVGINNHMGSRFTTHEMGMDSVMSVLKARELYFIDSRTSAQTVAELSAERFSIPTARRNVFLDNQADEKAILSQLNKLEKKAHKYGAAIGIGHPYISTLNALRTWLPTLEDKGIIIVRASQLLHPESFRQRYARPPPSKGNSS
ncbi:MAG: divergent polysaccharide deacetylase family protein, partial [Magnetococcales bacterium]|nr:divergent polysaccharide deacetylase family protein [Magnetococcales bacterium]